MITYYILLPFIFLLILVFGLAIYDFFKFRHLKLKNRPKITFLVPCWNDGDTIENTIKSIHNSYDNFELIVINDKSTDNSLEILKSLQKKYNFTLLDHKVNMGKVKSINEAADHVKTEIFFVIDADVVLNKKSIEDVLARFEHNKNLGAISCGYRVNHKGFWPNLLDIEYNMLNIIQYSYNITSTPAMWGGCMAVKKKIFFEVGKLSENAISEDTDMALKVINHKKEVQQSLYPILTHVPDTFRSWWKQKIRWHSGVTQCIIKYPKIWIRNPIPLLFPIFFIITILISLIYLPSELRFYDGLIHYFDLLEDSSGLIPAFITLWQSYGSFFIKKIIIGLAFVLFSLPYVAMTIKKPKEIYKLIWIFPFALFYLPLLTINFFFGIYSYIKRHSSLKKGARGW